MLKNSVNDLSNNFNKIKDSGNFIRVSVKYDDQPGNIQYQQKEEPGPVTGFSVKGFNYKVPCEVKSYKKPVEDQNISKENKKP